MKIDKGLTGWPKEERLLYAGGRSCQFMDRSFAGAFIGMTDFLTKVDQVIGGASVKPVQNDTGKRTFIITDKNGLVFWRKPGTLCSVFDIRLYDVETDFI